MQPIKTYLCRCICNQSITNCVNMWFCATSLHPLAAFCYRMLPVAAIFHQLITEVPRCGPADGWLDPRPRDSVQTDLRTTVM